MRTELFIAKRYLFSKRKVSFITVISTISIIGVAIGVAAMIIVLSVFNGFSKKVTSILIGFDPHIRIEAKGTSKIENYETLLQTIYSNDIPAAAPFTLNKGIKFFLLKGLMKIILIRFPGLRTLRIMGSLTLKTKEVMAVL
jgi:lipoprotein-releasing system permease protein